MLSHSLWLLSVALRADRRLHVLHIIIFNMYVRLCVSVFAFAFFHNDDRLYSSNEEIRKNRIGFSREKKIRT